MRLWNYAVDGKHWLVGGAINNAGLALTWFRDMLSARALPGRTVENIHYDDLIFLAQGAPAGAQGLLCLPFFAGERSPFWNMNARGVFFGLSLEHDTSHMSRALLEGVAFRLRSILDALLEMKIDVRRVRASGGYTRSDLWPQIIASVLDRQLQVPPDGFTSALGAAFWAMHGIGVIGRMDDAAGMVQVERIYEPDARNAKLYSDLYDLFIDLYHALGDGFDRRIKFSSV